MASQAVKVLVKRNVALVLGFQGTRYHGLQMAPQPGIPTIEAAVHGALHAAGAISDCNNGDRNKIKWSSASRTDKGVHAAACVCTAKLLVTLAEDGNVLPSSVEFWNSKLPSDIRILAVLRAPKNGRAHAICSRREYEYLLPKAALCGSSVADLRRQLKKFVGTHRFLNFAGRLKEHRKGRGTLSEDDEGAVGVDGDDGDEQDEDAMNVADLARDYLAQEHKNPGKRKAESVNISASASIGDRSGRVDGERGGKSAKGKKGRGNQRAPQQEHQRRQGDWACPKCQAYVFAKNQKCFKCQTPKPAAPAPAPASEACQEGLPCEQGEGEMSRAAAPEPDGADNIKDSFNARDTPQSGGVQELVEKEENFPGVGEVGGLGGDGRGGGRCG